MNGTKNFKFREEIDTNDYGFIYDSIGGRAYWAGRAAARPLFSRCGQSLFFARPLLWLKIYILS